MLKSCVDAVETQIDIVKEGSCRGKEEARDGVEVTLDYDGYLKNEEGKAGKKYTSTYSLSDPFSFTMGKEEVILGLEQGLIEFCAGSKLILHIPSELAYGQTGAGDTVPPGADLIFEVVLIEVKVLETQHEKNVRLEAKSRADEQKRRADELEKRRIAEIKAQEDYAKTLEREEKKREEELERRKVAEAKANESYEKQLAEELKRRETQQELVKQEIKRVEEHQKLIDEELERRKVQQKLVEEQQELVRQELKRREEHQKLIDEELERRKVQQELVDLELKAREDEAERRRIESTAREVQKEQVSDELLEREKETERRIIDQNARQNEQERRDEEDQGRLGGEKLSDEEKINQAAIFFKNRRKRIKNSGQGQG